MRVNKKKNETTIYVKSINTKTLMSGKVNMASLYLLSKNLVLIKIHKTNNKYILKIFYKNVTDFDDVYKYDIVECLLPCLYNHLLKTEKEYISKKWKQECGIAKCYQLDRVI
uniref:Protein kinase domain-containing protein n=1 Tax=Strongyloides stercoralis TaxID=6248 RepID=A0A0K0E5P6_STRER